MSVSGVASSVNASVAAMVKQDASVKVAPPTREMR